MNRLPLPELFPQGKKELPEVSGEPLWAHQQETREFCVDSPEVLDFSDPGTGKTRAHLQAFADLYQREEATALLVLCPKTLMASAWGADIDKYFPDLSYALAYAENREEAFEQDADIFITNIDAVKWLAKQPRRFFRRFGSRPMLLVDECTTYKHRTSQRSRAALAVSKILCTWRRGLTGTPNPNSVTELWHQALIVDGGQRLGTRFVPFRNSVCEPRQIGPKAEHVKWEDKPRSEEAVSFLLRDITIRHKFEECMDIPDNLVVSREFTINNRTRKWYEDFETHALLELEKGEVVGVNGAVIRNKLLQIASGAVYHSDGSYSVLDNTRYELITDLIENRRHSVVFFNWRHQVEQLIKLCEKRGITYARIDGTVSDKRRTQVVEAYQAGEFQTIFLHPRTGAHGLTLTRGEAVIWSSPIYEADLMEQGFRRIARGGQTKKTYTENVIAKDTVEELVYANTTGKGERMNNFRQIIELSRQARKAG